MLAVTGLFAWQASPQCRAWRDEVKTITVAELDALGYGVPQRPIHEEHDDLSPETIRQQVSSRAKIELAASRPTACF
jgi:hypothetical protein